MNKLTLHGARGSAPVSGSPFERYGGRTPCASLETSQGILILDAGTGIAPLGDALNNRSAIPPICILFTHFHLDHILGLTGFKPFFRKDAQIRLMAPAQTGDWKQALEQLFKPPFWPVELFSAGAQIKFESVDPSKAQSIFGVQVRGCAVRHPQGCVSYELMESNRRLVYASDREAGEVEMDKQFAEFCRGADLLIHDAQWLPEELPARAGWGHSTWEAAAQTAAQAKAKKLVLTSHDPARTDAQIDQALNQAKKIFQDVLAASENLSLSF